MPIGLCHMCLTSSVEIVDDEEKLCANCYPTYHRYKKGSSYSPENEAEKKYTIQDLKRKWNKQ
ncbi:MAG TPA: hypothetical protein HA319_04205 [Nitrosopumilaceae archaeon]|nr:hypothetical protein [Nitrosopumilaceae archaeon]